MVLGEKGVVFLLGMGRNSAPREGQKIPWTLMHQSFVSPATSGQGKSGAFNFSIFKAQLKALHCGPNLR